MKTSIAMICLLTLGLSGCATTRDSVLLGAGLGAGAGGAVGFAADQRSPVPTLIGTASGAITGGLIGFIIHKLNEKPGPAAAADATEKTSTPFVTKPEVRSLWVPDKIEDDGRRYIEGHRVYLLEKQSTFSQ